MVWFIYYQLYKTLPAHSRETNPITQEQGKLEVVLSPKYVGLLTPHDSGFEFCLV
jgi:hypothetical protein